MAISTIQEILPLVEKPSRYLGSEINSVKKAHEQVRLRFALAFPELYEIGTSHFGIQILYHVLNQHRDIAAERVFCPAADMKARLKSSGIPLFTLESHTPLQHFDIIGFSLLYELNYTNVLSMLDLGHIPFLSSERGFSHPLVIAGGPCTCNPEPVAEVFDAMVIGDGETVIVQMSELWMQWHESPSRDRETLLDAWSGIQGVYIPSMFRPRSNRDGTMGLEAVHPGRETVKRAIVADLDAAPFPDAPIVPYGRPVHDRLPLEIARGCTRGCRFCQAGMIYRPVRERAPGTILALADRALASTGYEDLSLLSLSTGDYRCLASLMNRLVSRGEREKIAVSLPSLRAGTLTPELMGLIRRVRKTGFTIAPEAGSVRLREMINKRVSEEEVLGTVENAFRLGWQVIKLYFMVGFPSETGADLQGIVDMVDRLKRARGSGGRKAKINVSVATFIPKPHTPFQWASQIPLAESKERIRWLKQELRQPRIHFKWQRPEVSFLEGLWARGDRRLTRLLAAAYQRGCEFDGWSDSFDYPAWTSALTESGIDPDFYTVRERSLSEALPWDHIDVGTSRQFLAEEWRKALCGRFTPDCRDGQCQDCGVCDLREVAPVVFSSGGNTRADAGGDRSAEVSRYGKVDISFSKLDEARFFGHLEMVNIFIRAFRRAAVPLRFSEGFHPKPRISFQDPLPVGIESRKEILTVEVPDHLALEGIVEELNAHLPKGLEATGCERRSSVGGSRDIMAVDYRVTAKQDLFDREKLEQVFSRREVLLSRTSKKGKQSTIDLKRIVQEIVIRSSCQLQLTLATFPGATVRPSDVIHRLFGVPRTVLAGLRILKLGDR